MLTNDSSMLQSGETVVSSFLMHADADGDEPRRVFGPFQFPESVSVALFQLF